MGILGLIGNKIKVDLGVFSTEISFLSKGSKNSSPNIQVGMSQAKAIENLALNGYTKNIAKNGTITMTRENKTYSFYTSTGGGNPAINAGVPSGFVRVEGITTAKLRFSGQ